MHQDTLHILFLIKPKKINRRGTCPIYCRVTFQKKRKEFSTGQFTTPVNWNSKIQVVTPQEIDSHIINGNIELIKKSLTKQFFLLQAEELDFNLQDILSCLRSQKSEEDEYLISYFKKYLKKQKKLLDIDIKLATWKKYNYVKTHTTSFIKWKYNENDIPLKKLNHQFLVDFEYFLKTKLNQKQVTINKEIQRLRKPIKEALNEGLLERDPFIKHKPKSVRKNVVFLDKEELDKLENYHFYQPRLNFVKDLFIFSCYSGLPYRELMNLKKKNIINGFDDNLWISIKREKTDKDLQVPLLPKAKQILDKYTSKRETIFPRISNQKLNSYLKEIAEVLGIYKRLTHHVARKTFATTVLLYNNIPMEIVSELLGHSSLKITEDYYGKILPKKISEHIQSIIYKTK